MIVGLVLVAVALAIAYWGDDPPPDDWTRDGWRQFSERQDKRREG